MMNRKLTLVLTLLFATVLMEAQITPQPTYLGDDKDRYLRSRAENKGIENADLKVSPPHWFKGMTNDRVELMVYQKDISKTKLYVNYPGVEVLDVSCPGNPNYLFVKLDVSNAKPGKFDLEFKAKSRKEVFPYELKPMDSRTNHIKGLDQSDLMYLIMPDRFANGDPTNDSAEDMNQIAVMRDRIYQRHGGDLQGVTKNLDYLKDLGVTAVWLNPVFENDQPTQSYHGYAITDHYEVDKRLGGAMAYRELSDELNNRGMKLVKDVIYNHMGSEHFLHKDPFSVDVVHQWPEFYRTNYRSTIVMDPYASTHDKKQFSDGWFDLSMPDVNQHNDHMATYLIQNTLWWVETFGLDALRIDTYAYSDHDFMKKLVKTVQEHYPQLTVFGEVWEDEKVGLNYWQNDSPLEGLIDFTLHFAVSKALKEKPGWNEGVAQLYYALVNDGNLKDPTANVTFLDNHDKSRYYSELGEDMDKWKMGMTLLFTLRGIPMLYYGTEILMPNFSNPDGFVRMDFPGGWPGDSKSLFNSRERTGKIADAWNFISTFATYRKNHPALHKGKITQWIPLGGTYAYTRHDENETFLIMINTDDKEAEFDMNRFRERTNGFGSAQDIITKEKVDMDFDGKFKIQAKGSLVVKLIR